MPNKFKWRVKTLGICVGAFIAISVAYAQFAVPTSDRVVSGILLSSGKDLAHFQIREGAMLTLRDEEQGFWYGLVPKIDRLGKHVTFKAFELTPHSESAPDVAEVIRSLDVPFGSQVELPLPLDAYSFSVTVERVGREKFPTIPAVKDPHSVNPQSLQKIYGASGGGLCALTCGSLTVTSTSVRMACGVCEGAR